MNAPTPTNESERLAALLSCEVLDTPPEPAFDDITRLAGQLCDTPMALVSLVDAQRQWFKSTVGIEPGETSRDVSFCAYAVAANAPLVVPDTLADPRFAHNPHVTGEPHVRFYAGVPLEIDEGVSVGTLCVLDRVPRELRPSQLDALAALARQIALELRLRRTLASTRSPSASSVPPAPRGVRAVEGRVVAGRYKIERVLGVGGMGIVVSALDQSTGERVAIKFITSDARESPEMLTRFVREAQAALRVGGEHVARVLDVGNLANGAPFIVMEHLDGADLDTRLRLGALPQTDAVDFIMQACAGVGRAHEEGILHRDLKPANLFVATRADGSTVVKVLDFGVSKFWRDQSLPTALTQAETVLGSPHYMSPEQMRSVPDLDARTDVWSLGVVLYELLTNALPFDGKTPAEIFARVLSDDQAPRLAVSSALADVVATSLAKDRDARYASAEAFAAALAPFGSGAVIHRPVTAPPAAYVSDAPTPPPVAPADAPLAPAAPSRAGLRWGVLVAVLALAALALLARAA